MAKTLFGALALASLPSAFAFRDTSPFFLFSSAELSINGNDAAIAQSSQLVRQATEALDKCPSGTYFVVRQEGVSSADYLDELSAPHLSHYLGGNNGIKSAMSVTEAVGGVDAGIISQHLQTKCGAEVMHVSLSKTDVLPRSSYAAEQLVVYLTLPTPPTSDRSTTLRQHDSFLDKLVTEMDPADFTVIYTTTAQTVEQFEETLQNQHTYEMEDSFSEAVHMELKRDNTAHSKAEEYVDNGGLFERYQYLSPGLFMGITAVIPLLAILYVGVNAITNLEVSYFAFSKEMGPAAQRRQ